MKRTMFVTSRVDEEGVEKISVMDVSKITNIQEIRYNQASREISIVHGSAPREAAAPKKAAKKAAPKKAAAKKAPAKKTAKKK